MAKRKKKARKAVGLRVHGIILGAIQQAVVKALRAKPVVVKTTTTEHDCFEIKGVVYDEHAAVQEILKMYSWWPKG